MAFTSIVAIYFLFFAFSAFLLLPFGVRTDAPTHRPSRISSATAVPACRSALRRACSTTTRISSRPVASAACTEQFADQDVRVDHEAHSGRPA